jgi:hypothetical protein
VIRALCISASAHSKTTHFKFLLFPHGEALQVLSPRILPDPKHLVRGRRLARGRNIWGSSDTSQRFAVLLESCKRPRATFRFRISGKALDSLELDAGSPNLPPQAGWAVPSCVLLYSGASWIRAGSSTKHKDAIRGLKPTNPVSVFVSTLDFQASWFRTFDGASK